jgi:type IV pilus assembly protein PilE
LLEVMITVAIVGILASIALPSYAYFITRGRLIEATNGLANTRSEMEKYYMDFRRYDAAGACGVTTRTPDPIAAFNGNPDRKFDVTCAAAAQTYTITATGITGGPMAGFVYTVDQAGGKTSAITPWSVTSANCWISKKDGSCL